MSEWTESIERIRGEWGKRLLILGHHYQNPEVLRHADELGDSLELSRKAASQRDAERIVFCGVRFMAESADILTSQAQSVYMPDPLAGCPMANMATVDAVEKAWQTLQSHAADWLPVVYVNSSAVIKALCGKWGGSTCTSSNASRVFQWAFEQGRRVFFLPDEHLGWNTAHDMGIPDGELAVYDGKLADGGLSAEAIHAARVVVWKGYCLVHTAFTRAQVELVRRQWPEARIIVHPETPREVLRLCDEHGSTAQIVRYVEAAKPGSVIVVGTEGHLVERLAMQHAARGVTVKSLHPSICSNMAKTNERNLLAVLRDWPASCRISVPPDVADGARQALTRMLSL